MAEIVANGLVTNWQTCAIIGRYSGKAGWLMDEIKRDRSVRMALLVLAASLLTGQSDPAPVDGLANGGPVTAGGEFETAFACAIAADSQSVPSPEVPPGCDDPGPPLPVRPDAPDIFGLHAVPVGSPAIQARWDAARQALFGEMPGAWDELLEPANLAASGDPLEAVNRWVNWHVRFVEDAGSDEWSSAQATLSRGYGDCEDFAIAKLALLEKAGVPADSMYLIIVREKLRPRDHAVLAVRHNGSLKILDSRTDKLLSDKDVADYIPTISYNGSFAWIYGTRRNDAGARQASVYENSNFEVEPIQSSDQN